MNFPCSKLREAVPAVNCLRQEEVIQQLTEGVQRLPGVPRGYLGKLSTSCYILSGVPGSILTDLHMKKKIIKEQGPVLNPVHVQKDHGRNTEKWLVLLELHLSPWWGPYCPVITKLSLHHGGKLRALLKSLQTDWKELKVQTEGTVSLGQVH